VNIKAVLTGDIVNSQKITGADYDLMLANLKDILAQLQQGLPMDYDIYRGDAFQLILSQPETAMYVAIVIHLSLRSHLPPVDVRQCIGLGEVTTRRESVKQSTGEAFTLSGQGLDNIKGRGICIASSNADFQMKMTLLTRFFDHHLASLTRIQSEVLLCYLLATDKSHENLAKRLNKKRSNVTRILNASQYQLVVAYLDFYTQQVKMDFNG
jgi:hypothetical protein